MRCKSYIPEWIDLDEVDQVKAMARLEAEATGFDPDVAAQRAASAFISEERLFRKRNVVASSFSSRPDQKSFHDGTLSWMAEADKVKSIRPAKIRTDGQRKRFLRNQAILALSIAGFSHRQLASVFDLPHSRISANIDEMRGLVA